MACACHEVSFSLVWPALQKAESGQLTEGDVLTPTLYRPRKPKTAAGLSLGVLAFVLMAAPVMAATPKAEKAAASAKAKTEKTEAGKKADKPSLKTTPLKSDEEKALKTSKSDKLASAEKGSKDKTAKGAKAAKLADADDDTTKSKSSKAKASKSSKLADADDDTKPAKGKKTVSGKTVKTADASDKKTKGKTATKLADADDDAKPAKASKASAKSPARTTQTFQSPVKVTMDLPKAPAVATKAAAVAMAAPAPAPVDDTPKLNAAPVPYHLVSQAPAMNPVAVDYVLSPGDVTLYQAAFSSIDAGDFDGAEASLTQVSDKSLVGYAEYHKLFSRGYTASYDELISWLNSYGDEPMAMAVWNLAKRKKPDGAPDPAFPLLNGKPQVAAATAPDGTAVQLAAYTTLDTAIPVAANAGPGIDDGGAASFDGDLTPKSARSAYNNGQLEQAVTLGRKIGDHWVAGLAEWRLGRFDQAEAEFKFVSTDPSRNAWSQSSGAYWAGRCALRQGHGDEADTYFKIAASFPFTFYGLLAEQRLGVTPAVVLSKQGALPTFTGGERTALTASLDGDFSWTRSSPKAVRLNALIQIGRNSDAQKELQSAVQTSGDGGERDRWLALSARTHVDVNSVQAGDRLFDASIYPMPGYTLKGGYKVDRALVYAFARKESKFNPKAISYSGAYGLLQLMPATAALIENDSSFSAKPAKLLKPATNLRVGQDYIQRLSGSPIVQGDLLRTIAAYNAGPRPVKDATDSLGPDADALLVMESIPVAQTRQYVEEVAANYWIYRQLMGKSSKTLAMAAGDAKIIDINAD